MIFFAAVSLLRASRSASSRPLTRWMRTRRLPRTATLPAPVDKFKTTRDAFRTGIEEYNAGHKAGAVKALEFAASQGHALARWKLGKMYADGDGVQQNDLKAFENFSRIADEHADENPDSSNSRFVSSAFVALGSYYLDGIPGTYVKPNGQRAREMFQYAASYFGDPDAQYNLARLFLDGVGGGKDMRQAMRWLNSRSRKAARPLTGPSWTPALYGRGRHAPEGAGLDVVDDCAGRSRSHSRCMDPGPARSGLCSGRRYGPAGGAGVSRAADQEAAVRSRPAFKSPDRCAPAHDRTASPNCADACRPRSILAGRRPAATA